MAGLKLHLGCGDKRKPGWVNIDILDDADLKHDLRKPMPFEDGSAVVVHSEHFLEHLEYPDEVVPLLAECRRVLVPGGEFHVGVPDARPTLEQYVRGELPALLREWSKKPEWSWFPDYAWKTPMHFVNFDFRQWTEHRYMYDEETLVLVLREAGFVNVRRRDFDPELDSEDRREWTLYVQATNP